jgi:hypothetical protein
VKWRRKKEKKRGVNAQRARGELVKLWNGAETTRAKIIK